MQVKVVNISTPLKNGALASAKVELRFDNDKETLTIDDLRVLRNQYGELWIAFPSRNWNGSYLQMVFASPRVKRMIDAVVIPAYEEWAETQNAQSAQAENGGAR